MKKMITLLCLTIFSASLFAQKMIINDDNAELRKVGAFIGIKVSSSIDLYLTQSDEDAIAVSAKDVKYRDRIKTEVKDGILKIWFDGGNGWSWSNGDKKMKAYVSFKSISSLVASGASDIYVTGKISATDLLIECSGASDFKGEVDVKNLTLRLSGASDAKIKGRVQFLDANANGASDLNGYDLVADNCNLSASGASGIKITANKEMNVKASGASDIYYKGDAVIRDMKTSGSSSISKKS